MEIFTVIFALLIGVLSIWFSVKMLKLYYKVKKWSKVDAKVISKEISIHKKYSSRRTPYKVSANFNYTYNGINYTGNKIYLVELLGGQANHMKADAERKLQQIKEYVMVFVNPNDPAESVMYCDGVVLYFIALIVGIFALLFGLISLI